VRRVVARVLRGQGDAGPYRTAVAESDVEGLLPHAERAAARLSAALMELGAVVCTARAPRCGACPVRAGCAWRLAGMPSYTGPQRPAQPFAGTDRQVRGRLLDVLRDAPGPVPAAAMDLAWADSDQRARCLESLLADGLVERRGDGRYALPGERAPSA
jgi:A/G-specific adenine glycosylase